MRKMFERADEHRSQNGKRDRHPRTRSGFPATPRTSGLAEIAVTPPTATHTFCQQRAKRVLRFTDGRAAIS
jgi:hypothetical protein